MFTLNTYRQDDFSELVTFFFLFFCFFNGTGLGRNHQQCFLPKSLGL